MQTENQSLIAKLMQARYYPSGSFRDANIGGNPSFIWRSIFEAKQLIEAGSRGKVGNGESINIWLDPWVPASNNARVTTSMVPNLQDATSSSLFKPGTKEWNYELINDIFNEEDACNIM